MNYNDAIQAMLCEPAREMVFAKDDLSLFDGCHVAGTDEFIAGPSDAAINKIIEKIKADADAMETALAAQASTQADTMKKCMDAISNFADGMSKTGDSIASKSVSIGKLQEVWDNVIPLKSYFDVISAGFDEKSVTRIGILTIATEAIKFAGEIAVTASTMAALGSYASYSNMVKGGFSIGMFAPKFDAEIPGLQDSLDTKDYDITDAMDSKNISLIVHPVGKDTSTSGTLYDFYNMLKDPLNNFFTLEERGLTESIDNVDASLLAARDGSISNGVESTAAQAVLKAKQGDKDYYIADNAKYMDFFKNLHKNVEARIAEVKPTITRVTDMQSAMTDLGNAHIEFFKTEYSFGADVSAGMKAAADAFYKAFDIIDSELNRLITEKNTLIESINPDNVVNDMSKTCDCVATAMRDIADAGDDNKKKDDDGGDNVIEPLTAIKMSLSFMDIDGTKPTQQKHCYWLRFAQLATKFGFLPFPDLMMPTSLRYWPVGFLISIPAPPGIIKIALPIIWIPLITLSGFFGTVVLFIGLCGIMPAPYVFYVSNTGTKKFFLTLRGPGDKMGSDSSDELLSKFIQTPLSLVLKANELEIQKYDPSFKRPQPESFDSVYGKFRSSVESRIDSMNMGFKDINILKLNIKARSANKSISVKHNSKDFSAVEVVQAVEKDLASFIDAMDMPIIKIPGDDGKAKKKDAALIMMSDLADYMSMKFKSPNMDIIDLRDRVFSNMTSYESDASYAADTSEIPNNVNLKSADHMKKFQKFLKKCIAFGVKQLDNDELLVGLIAFSAFFVNNPFKCKDPSSISPADAEKILAIIAVTKALDAALENITFDNIASKVGILSFNKRNLMSVALEVLKSLVPPIPWPGKNFGTGMDVVISKNALTIAMTSSFSLDFLPIQDKVSINTGDIVKPALKGTISGLLAPVYDTANLIDAGKGLANQTLNFGKTLSIGNNSDVLRLEGIDFKPLIRDAVVGTMDGVASTIQPIYDLFVLGIRGFDPNLIDMIMSPLETAKSIAKNMVNSDEFGLMIPNDLLIYEARQLLNKVEGIPFVVPAALCAFAQPVVDIIRDIHPILRFDDLPPWERLTTDNILFCFFLDEFCHQGKKFGGFFESFI
jgi:hypothetical protein